MGNQFSEEPLISVIIPAYQSCVTLPRAINSVVKQTYKNIEIIIVNNGSTDKTQELVTSIMAQDDRVRLVRLEENIQPAGGRNAGVAHSTGEYIAFLDADDEWLSEKIELQIIPLIDNPEIGLVFTDSYNINTKTGKSEKYSDTHNKHLNEMQPVPLTKNSPLRKLTGPVRKLIYEKCIINLSSVILRKSLFNKIGGFNTLFFGPEDIDFWVRLAKITIFAYLDIPLVNRFYSDENLSMKGDQWLINLLKYHKHCFRNAEYQDLHTSIKKNLEKYFRFLIIIYGQLGKKKEALITCLDSIKYGSFPKVILLTFLAQLGNKLFSHVIKINQELVRTKEYL